METWYLQNFNTLRFLDSWKFLKSKLLKVSKNQISNTSNKKSKPKKKIVYIESESEPEIEYKKISKPKEIKQAPTYEKPPPLQRSIYYA